MKSRSFGGIRPSGAERFPVKSHHVEMETIGRNRVTAKSARQSPSRFSNRLFQQWPRFQSVPRSMLILPAATAVPAL